MARKKIERNIAYDEDRKVYYVCMDLGKDEMGVRHRKYRTCLTLSAARAVLREFLADRDRARRIPRTQMTLEDWLENWMETIVRPNRAETTAYAYEKIIENHLGPTLGRKTLQKLTPGDIQRYYVKEQREKGLSSNTMRRHHDLLSAALRTAVRQELLAVSPMDRVEAPKPRPYEAAFYDQEEMKRLYSLLTGHRLEVPAKLAGSLGLRRGELCGLRWEHVNFQRRLIEIRETRTVCGSRIICKETKNRSSVRTLYMAEELYRLLLWEQERQRREVKNPSGYVVLDKRGKPYSPNVLSLAFTRFIRENGLPRVTLHGLRHSFASIASYQGVSLFDIGKALGHSTPATTGRIYTHLIDRTHQDTVTKVSNALK